MNSASKAPRTMRLLPCACALALLAVTTRPAQADPWIPAAGHGVIDPMLRYFSANNAFSKTHFGSSTYPSSQQRETQLRLTGSQGIGNRLSIEYDLRGGSLQETRHHAGKQVTNSSSGLEDQVIGLNYGLRQSKSFADSISLNVVLPTGSTTQAPTLGAGKAAIEPDYQVGIARGAMFATLVAGPRVFLDGGAVQLRTSLSLGYRVTPRFRVSGSVFYVRTLQRQQVVAVADRGEIYNLLRVGAKLEYLPSGRFRPWRPYIGYQDSLAGKGIHAGRRIVIGLAVHY